VATAPAAGTRIPLEHRQAVDVDRPGDEVIEHRYGLPAEDRAIPVERFRLRIQTVPNSENDDPPKPGVNSFIPSARHGQAGGVLRYPRQEYLPPCARIAISTVEYIGNTWSRPTTATRSAGDAVHRPERIRRGRPLRG